MPYSICKGPVAICVVFVFGLSACYSERYEMRTATHRFETDPPPRPSHRPASPPVRDPAPASSDRPARARCEGSPPPAPPSGPPAGPECRERTAARTGAHRHPRSTPAPAGSQARAAAPRRGRRRRRKRCSSAWHRRIYSVSTKGDRHLITGHPDPPWIHVPCDRLHSLLLMFLACPLQRGLSPFSRRGGGCRRWWRAAC